MAVARVRRVVVFSPIHKHNAQYTHWVSQKRLTRNKRQTALPSIPFLLACFFPLLLVNMYLENLQQLADFAIPFPDTVKDVMENAADHVQKMENPVQSRDYQKI